MADLAQGYATWFRRELTRRKLTQEVAGRELRVSLATIQRWSAGRSLPRYEELVKIRKIWGVLPPPLG
jgi:transcriptional regulator with XRE-family HTH domain